MPAFAATRSEPSTGRSLIAALCEVFEQAAGHVWVEPGWWRRIFRLTAIQTVGQAVNDPQALARGLIVEIQHPTLDAVRSIANPVRLSGTPVVYRLPPPLLGEHRVEVLRGLGCTTQEIAEALEAGAV